MKKNVAIKSPPILTHEGAPAARINTEKQLRRSLMSCFLWEKEFYENGEDISKRIASLIPQVEPEKVALMAIEAREQMKLRHAPLFIVREMARHEKYRPLVADTLARVIQRADELAEFLAMYFDGKKIPVAHSVRKGLDGAIRKFDEYALAKYDRKGQVSLRDVFRIVHPIPENDEQKELWGRVVKGELKTPDTWEVELSRNDGVSKTDKWSRLLKEEKLGALALLRNLRNIEQAQVSRSLIREAIARMSVYRVLPFRFIAAERHAPHLSDVLEEKFFECAGSKKLSGLTKILVDVSGSMESSLSSKSDMKRMDAAVGVAMVAREICEEVVIYTFSNGVVAVPNRRGFALGDAVIRSQPHSGTYIGDAVSKMNTSKHDRLIVITDEQSHDRVPDPVAEHAYMINVASAKNGVGYGKWTHIDGFSEAIFNYILEIEDSVG